jgi:hypothetical protein
MSGAGTGDRARDRDHRSGCVIIQSAHHVFIERVGVRVEDACNDLGWRVSRCFTTQNSQTKAQRTIVRLDGKCRGQPVRRRFRVAAFTFDRRDCRQRVNVGWIRFDHGSQGDRASSS